MYNNYYVTLLNRAELNITHSVILHYFLYIFLFFFLFNGPWWIRRYISLDLCVPDKRDGLDATVVSVYHLYIIDQYRGGNNWSWTFVSSKRQKRRKATVRRINSYSSFVFACFVSTFFFNKTCEKLYTIFTIIIWQDHGRTFPCDRTSVRMDLGLAKTHPPRKDCRM